jgi:beta-lactamase regulating signal transducer with metallopeptidase domain
VQIAAAEMRIDPPAVVIVNGSDIPFITGVLQPVLALPISLLRRLRPAALDLVIRHELVHLARRDVLWNFIVVGACVPFGWHPSVRRVMQEIVLAREEAVDAAVGSTSPCAYARVLVDVAAETRGRPHMLAVGIEPSSLERRITRLLEPPVETRAAVWRIFALASLVLIAALVSPRLGLRPLSIYGESEPKGARTSAVGAGVSLLGIPRDCPKNDAGGCDRQANPPVK